MKLKLLGAFLAVLCSLPAFSQQGVNCSDPIFISLPFQVSSSTANFGDTYDTPQGLNCNASTTNYFAGNDVFYSFIAENNSVVNITMTPSAGNSAIFVYDYCSSIGNSCIAGMANSSNNPRNISFTTTVGQSYIIAISSSSATQTFGYNLLVQKQDCGPNAMPVNLNAVATSTTATLSWTNPSINLWEVAFQNAGGMVPQPGDATEYVTSPSLVKTGLSVGNSYQFWVRGICSSGVFSAWAGPFVFQTTVTCFPPTQLSAANITATSANASWNATTGTSFQAYLIPGNGTPANPGNNPVTNNGNMLFNTSLANYSFTNLQPGTNYNYYVRSFCAESQVSGWAGPYSFETPLCNAEDKCNYTFRMTDSGNNGWNGAVMQVKQSGKIITSTGGATSFGPTYITGAGPVNITYSLCKDKPFEVYWLTAGTQPQECVLSVINSFGQTIYTKPANSGTPGTTVYTGNVNCTTPSCDIVPSALAASIGTSTVTLSWSAIATSSWDIYVIPAGSPAPNAGSTPTYNDVTINGFTPTGLIQSTAYDFYVRTNCAPSPSEWSQAGTFTTPTTCYKPTQLAVSGITQTAATVSWATGSSLDSNWDILLVPGSGTPANPGDNPSASNGNILVNTSTASPFTFTNLQSGTIYNYFIRTVCSASDKSLWSGPFAFNTILCDNSNKCNYKFILTDTAGNGWNGARMQVRQNGITVATLGTQITGSGPTTVTVALCTNIPFDVYWSVAGTADSEIGFSVQNPFVDTIYNYTPGSSSQGQVIYSGISNCSTPACQKPMTLTASGTTQTTAQLSWTAVNGETQWEVYAVPKGSAPPVNGSAVSGTGSYYIANTNVNFTVSGLLPATIYTFYVRTICSSSSQSTWTLVSPGLYSPGSFTTKPLNDEPANAFTITPSPNWSCNNYTSGNETGATPTTLLPFSGNNCQYNNPDTWFVFTATSTLHVINIKNILPTASINYSLFSGNPQNLTLVYCSNGNTSSVASNLVVGTQYYIRVYSLSLQGTIATFDLCITTPPAQLGNDECSNAITAPVNTGTVCELTTPGNIIAATASTATGVCMGTAAADVWFTFTATSGAHNISLNDIVGTTQDLRLAIYGGNCDVLGTPSCSMGNTLGKSDFIPGHQYLIRVWSNSSLPQAVTFNLCIKSLLSCYTAEPFCGSSPDDPYVFENVTMLNDNSQVACLGTIPNPAYYYLKVGETGPLSFQIMQSDNFDSLGNPLGTRRDVDFVAWGPFSSPDACSQISMTGCPTCPNNTSATDFYPFGNIVDCSYSASATETFSIPNAQAGEYYMVLITNFSNQPGYIKLMQTNYFDANAGHTYCVDKIQLVAFIDANGNGTKEASEINTNIGNFIFQKNNTGPVSNVYSPIGTYNVYSSASTDTFDFSYQVNPEWAPYFSPAPTNYNDISIVPGSGAQVYYFPISVVQNYTDVAVSVTPFGSPRPGQSFANKVTLKNKGFSNLSGTLVFNKDNALQITALSNTSATITPAGFAYNFTGLLPYETRTIYVTFSVPALPTVALGQSITNSVSLLGFTEDIHPVDNSASVTQTIVGSYDPNDKLETHGHEVNLANFGTTGYLYYTIRFQNTGNAEAFHVKIKDLLGNDLDPSSLRMVGSSHNYVLERVGHQLTWDFDNIQLPGISTSEELSKGYVTFMIKPLPGYNTGDTIDNGAEIYFDTNPAIYTNVFQTLFTGMLSAPVFNEKGLVLYPNPANSKVTVSLGQQGITLKKIMIYDMVGKLVRSFENLQSAEATLDVSGLSKGMYVTEIVTSSDFKIMKKLMIK